MNRAKMIRYVLLALTPVMLTNCSGCGDDDNSQTRAQKCMSDPVCMQMVRQSMGPVLFPLGAAGGVPQAVAPVPNGSPFAGAPPGSLPYVPHSVGQPSSAAIAAQHQMVRQALKQMSMDPDSIYYEPPPPSIVPKTAGRDMIGAQQIVEDRRPASGSGGGELAGATK